MKMRRIGLRFSLFLLFLSSTVIDAGSQSTSPPSLKSKSRLLRVFPLEANPVFSKNSKLLAVKDDKNLAILELPALSVKLTLTPCDGKPFTHEFQLSDTVILTYCYKEKSEKKKKDELEKVESWSVEDGKRLQLRELEERKLKIYRIKSTKQSPIAYLSPNEERMVLSDFDDETIAELWDVEKEKKIRNLEAFLMKSKKKPRVFSVDFSPDGKTLAVVFYADIDADFDRRFSPQVYLWDAQTGKFKNLLIDPDHVGEPRSSGLSVIFTSDSKYLISSYGRIWDIETGRIIYSFDHGNPKAISPDGRILVTVGGLEVKLWDLNTRKLIGKIPAMSDWFHGTAYWFTCQFSSDGKKLYIDSYNDYFLFETFKFYIWDLDEKSFIVKGFNVYDLPSIWKHDLSSDFKYVLVYRGKKGIELYEIE